MAAPRPIHHDGWVYEEKVDGWRMVVYKEGDRVSLVSRQGKDLTRWMGRLPCCCLCAGSLTTD